MELLYQKEALDQLNQYHKANKHSILLQGIAGSGKTYLAHEFSKLKSQEYGFAQFHTVQPKVNDLKELIDNSFRLDEVQVICIENLDKGVNAASQVILKYLEEPLPNVYIIVTCVNSAKLPDTILSRAVQIVLPNPTAHDIEVFAKTRNQRGYEIAHNYSIYKCCKSLTDVVTVLNLSVDKLQYYDKIKTNEFWKDSVDQIVWNLSHYEDNSKVDLRFALLVLWRSNCNSLIRTSALQALRSLEVGRVSESAILNKLVLDVKL